jgi:hypothetical protein
MHDDFRNHAREEEFEEAQGEAEACPIMAIFHHFQTIALEINLFVKVHLMKCLHWYAAFSIVLHAILVAAEMQIVLHRPARVPCFLIFPR